MKQSANRQQHFGIRKLTVEAAFVLLGTTLWMNNGAIVHADEAEGNDQGDSPEKS